MINVGRERYCERRRERRRDGGKGRERRRKRERRQTEHTMYVSLLFYCRVIC